MSAPQSYHIFDIEVERRGERYWVQVLNSPAGQSEEPFDVPFTMSELRSLLAESPSGSS